MKSSQIIIATLTLILVGVVLGCVFFYVTYAPDTSSLDYMISLQKGPFNFNDTAGDIAAEGPEDVGWMLKDNGDIMIYYGRMTINVNEQARKNEQFMFKLQRVGVEITPITLDDGSTDYKLTVWGTPIEKWTKVN